MILNKLKAAYGEWLIDYRFNIVHSSTNKFTAIGYICEYYLQINDIIVVIEEHSIRHQHKLLFKITEAIECNERLVFVLLDQAINDIYDKFGIIDKSYSLQYI